MAQEATAATAAIRVATEETATHRALITELKAQLLKNQSDALQHEEARAQTQWAYAGNQQELIRVNHLLATAQAALAACQATNADLERRLLATSLPAGPELHFSPEELRLVHRRPEAWLHPATECYIGVCSGGFPLNTGFRLDAAGAPGQQVISCVFKILPEEAQPAPAAEHPQDRPQRGNNTDRRRGGNGGKGGGYGGETGANKRPRP
jgi:hypothetical protein